METHLIDWIDDLLMMNFWKPNNIYALSVEGKTLIPRLYSWIEGDI